MTTETKSRPIIFSAAEVRAIIAGRKTQTRRVVTNERICVFAPGYADDRERIIGLCPYGRVGEHLWVCESWRAGGEWDDDSPREIEPRSWTEDRADIYYEATPDDPNAEPDTMGWGKKRCAIHMPRWASRITLEITNIRVQMVSQISREDRIAEGFVSGSAVEFQQAWDKLNANRGFSWSSNPWVWAISFRGGAGDARGETR